MKKIVLVFLFFLAMNTGYSQFIVEDPANLAINTSIQSLNAATNLLDQFMAKAEKLKLATEIFDQMKTIAEIMGYIDELACLTSELKFNLNYANNFSCLTVLNFREINMGLQYTTDLIVKVFLAKNLLTMGSGERLGILNNILSVLKKTVSDISRINLNVRTFSRGRITKKYFKENVYASGNGFLTNRYDRRKKL